MSPEILIVQRFCFEWIGTSIRSKKVHLSAAESVADRVMIPVPDFSSMWIERRAGIDVNRSARRGLLRISNLPSLLTDFLCGIVTISCFQTDFFIVCNAAISFSVIQWVDEISHQPFHSSEIPRLGSLSLLSSTLQIWFTNKHGKIRSNLTMHWFREFRLCLFKPVSNFMYPVNSFFCRQIAKGDTVGAVNSTAVGHRYKTRFSLMEKR